MSNSSEIYPGSQGRQPMDSICHINSSYQTTCSNVSNSNSSEYIFPKNNKSLKEYLEKTFKKIWNKLESLYTNSKKEHQEIKDSIEKIVNNSQIGTKNILQRLDKIEKLLSELEKQQ